MTRRFKITLSIVFVSGAIAFATFAVLFLKLHDLLSPDERQVDVGPLRVTKTTSCTTRPISLDEAQTLFHFPFPKTATNIQYGCYTEWVAYEVYLRFEAPSADCIAAVPAALDYQGFTKIKITPLSDDDRALRSVKKLNPVSTSPLVIPWFNPDQIQTGLETGFAGSYQPKVWIDTQRGIFYYQLGD